MWGLQPPRARACMRGTLNSKSRVLISTKNLPSAWPPPPAPAPAGARARAGIPFRSRIEHGARKTDARSGSPRRRAAAPKPKHIQSRISSTVSRQLAWCLPSATATPSVHRTQCRCVRASPVTRSRPACRMIHEAVCVRIPAAPEPLRVLTDSQRRCPAPQECGRVACPARSGQCVRCALACAHQHAFVVCARPSRGCGQRPRLRSLSPSSARPLTSPGAETRRTHP